MKLFLQIFLLLMLIGIGMACRNTTHSDVKCANGLNIPEKEVVQHLYEDVIVSDSIKINGFLPYEMPKDSLFILMPQEKYIIEREWAASAAYPSDETDSMEFIVFPNKGLRYICNPDWRSVYFFDMYFNKGSYLKYRNFIFSEATTYEDICAQFPNSCTQSSYDSQTRKRILRFRPAPDFYESTEFWV